jgi:hypothetical protein
MASSGMLHRVVHVTIDVLEERIASIIRVTRIGELGTLAVSSNRSMLQRNTMCSIYFVLFLRCMLRLLVTTDVVPSSPILVVLMEGDTFLQNVGSHKSRTV